MQQHEKNQHFFFFFFCYQKLGVRLIHVCAVYTRLYGNENIRKCKKKNCHVIAARKIRISSAKILILGYENTEKLKYNLAALVKASTRHLF